ncbi:MAG: DUF2066 domain-containing protein [Rhodospirillales bacterium]|nr:MAG: DUF2066 domain-containing protein [Rhodospirillales bacterium]
MIDETSVGRLVRAGLAVLIFACGVVGPAWAQDLFEVTGLPVDARAADELQAKQEGIAEAQQQALQTVFRRLVAADEVVRLPEVTSDMLIAMVRDFDISDEKFGGGRYLATLSVRFDPQKVAEVLRSQRIRFAMTRSQPVVVLPVIDVGTAQRLWDDPNPWRDAWAGQLPHPGLFSLVMPIGDLTDVAVVNVNYALAGDPVGLEQIASRYDAAGTVVAVAAVGRGGGAGRLVNITLTFSGGGYDGRVIERRYSGSGSLQSFLNQVVTEVMRDLETTWKDENMLDFTLEERISVLVPIEGLGDWITIRDQLSSMARIQSLAVARMTRTEAEVDLVYVGTTEQLRSALALQGLELVFTPERPLWLLRPMGRR